MAQNKSDFIKDPEVIKEEMKKLMDHLRVKKGYNIDSNIFQMGKDPNGDVMILRTTIDSIQDVPSDWKYGTYYLDGGYPKTGFYTMKDGQYLFIPTKNEIDKSQDVEYKTPQQVSEAILAENPQIDRTQLSFTHEGIIQISGVIGHINLPTTDLHYNEQEGCIESTIFPDRKFYVEFVKAQEVDVNNIGGTSAEQTSMDTDKNLEQQPVREFDDSKEQPRHEGARIEDYGVALFNFNAMKYAFEHYKLDELGNVVEKEDDNAIYSIETRRVDNARIEATLELNEIWIEAYHRASRGARANEEGALDNSPAFAGENSATEFDKFVNIVQSNNGKKLSEISQILFDVYGMDRLGTLKLFLNFLAHPSVATVFQLEIDMSPDAAIESVDKMAHKYLKDEWNDLTSGMDDDGMDDDFVMERKFPPMN